MTGKPEQDELQREAAEAAGKADDEEPVRRIARRFLATPPQPKKAAQKDDGNPRRAKEH